MDADLFACRLCSSNQDLVDVGSEKTQFAAEYRNIVKIMTGIRIYPNDRLLSSICRACLKRAIENYDYRRNALQRNQELTRKREALEKQMQQANKKVEKSATDAQHGSDHADSCFDADTEVEDEVQFISISLDITARDTATPPSGGKTSAAPAPTAATVTATTPSRKGTSAALSAERGTATSFQEGRAAPSAMNDIATSSIQHGTTTANAPSAPSKSILVLSESESAQASEQASTIKTSIDKVGPKANCDKVAQKQSTDVSSKAHEKRTTAVVSSAASAALCQFYEAFVDESETDGSSAASPRTEVVVNSQNARDSKKTTTKAKQPHELKENHQTSGKSDTNESAINDNITKMAEAFDKHDNVVMHPNIRKIMAEYPKLKLPQSVFLAGLAGVSVKLTHSAVKRHITKLNRRSRRGKNKKRKVESDFIQRMDIPDVMPTCSKELKELVTSSLGLRRIGASPPWKTRTPVHTPIENAVIPASPLSSFTFPETTPIKSILHPAVANSPKLRKIVPFNQSALTSTPAAAYQPLPHIADMMEANEKTPTKSSGTWVDGMGFASPVDMEYSQIQTSCDEESEQEENPVSPAQEDVEAVEVLEMLEDESASNVPDYSLIKVADEEVIYICDQCHRVFQHKSSFKRHHRSVHLRCVFCSRRFETREDLVKHVKAQCPKKTRKVRVRVMRMEEDSGIKRLLPQWYLDKTGAFKVQSQPVQELHTPSADEENAAIVANPEPSEPTREKDKVLPEDTGSSFCEYGTDEVEPILDVENMNLFAVPNDDDDDINFEFAETDEPEIFLEATGGNDESVKELQVDEAMYVQNILQPPQPGKHQKEQVTPKDFVGIDTDQQTLCIKGLGRVLARDEIIPVELLYQKKRLKMRIADFVPPVHEEKFYDFSKVAPVSLLSCRYMSQKRTVYNFMSTAEASAKSTLCASATSSTNDEPKRKKRVKKKDTESATKSERKVARKEKATLKKSTCTSKDLATTSKAETLEARTTSTAKVSVVQNIVIPKVCPLQGVVEKSPSAPLTENLPCNKDASHAVQTADLLCSEVMPQPMTDVVQREASPVPLPAPVPTLDKFKMGFSTQTAANSDNCITEDLANSNESNVKETSTDTTNFTACTSTTFKYDTVEAPKTVQGNNVESNTTSAVIAVDGCTVINANPHIDYETSFLSTASSDHGKKVTPLKLKLQKVSWTLGKLNKEQTVGSNPSSEPDILNHSPSPIQPSSVPSVSLVTHNDKEATPEKLKSIRMSVIQSSHQNKTTTTTTTTTTTIEQRLVNTVIETATSETKTVVLDCANNDKPSEKPAAPVVKPIIKILTPHDINNKRLVRKVVFPNKAQQLPTVSPIAESQPKQPPLHTQHKQSFHHESTAPATHVPHHFTQQGRRDRPDASKSSSYL